MSSSLKRITAVLILVLVVVPVLFAVPASAHDWTNHSLDQILLENDYSYETSSEVVYRLSGYCSSETNFISNVDDSGIL